MLKAKNLSSNTLSDDFCCLITQNLQGCKMKDQLKVYDHRNQCSW